MGQHHNIVVTKKEKDWERSILVFWYLGVRQPIQRPNWEAQLCNSTEKVITYCWRKYHVNDQKMMSCVFIVHERILFKTLFVVHNGAEMGSCGRHFLERPMHSNLLHCACRVVEMVLHWAVFQFGQCTPIQCTVHSNFLHSVCHVEEMALHWSWMPELYFNLVHCALETFLESGVM